MRPSASSSESAELHVLVLGSGAGGGSPQWNCACAVCQAVRRGEAPERTQTSIAVSADGHRWVLVNASPDLRQQLLDREALWPAREGRHSPISAVVLTGAEIDQVAGLVNLREGHAFSLYGSEQTLAALGESAIFEALDPSLVPRRRLPSDDVFEPLDADGRSLGLQIEPFAVPGKVALYQEGDGKELELDAEDGRTVGLRIQALGSDRSLFFIPGCARWTDKLRARLDGAAAVMFDGTLWRDDEMIERGLSHKTGRRMGHMSISGADGTIETFAGLDIERRIFIHINNTNPVLLPDSRERERVEEAGWDIAFDGMELTL